jgi:hypothetical protein
MINISLLKGVLGLSFRTTELPDKIAGTIWFMTDNTGKSKDDRISTIPNYKIY